MGGMGSKVLYIILYTCSARGAAQVPVAKSSTKLWGLWREPVFRAGCWGREKQAGPRQRHVLAPAQPKAKGLGWAQGSVLGRQ